MKRNPRYIWKGERSSWEVRREFSKTQLMLISSISEGGANVVSEALVAGVPIVASNINGNMGMLGEDYLGYFNVGDEASLRGLLLKCERDKEFMLELDRICKARAELFQLSEEERRWKNILSELEKK